MIDFEQLVLVIQRFQYVCNLEDKNELRIWLYNNGLFAPAPKYFDENSILFKFYNNNLF